jgi:hypothetical protein
MGRRNYDRGRGTTLGVWSSMRGCGKLYVELQGPRTIWAEGRRVLGG